MGLLATVFLFIQLLHQNHGNFQSSYKRHLIVLFYNSYKNQTGQNKNGSGSYVFSSDNYNAGKCGSGHNLSGDIPQGNATYDSARANMREPWMMLTKDQGQELIGNTTSTWNSINGVNGRKFTNKTDTSKYIFLPA